MSWRKWLFITISLAIVIGTVILMRPAWRGSEGLVLPGVVEIQEVRLGSKIGGRVAEVLVREGDQTLVAAAVVPIEAPGATERGHEIQQALFLVDLTSVWAICSKSLFLSFAGPMLFPRSRSSSSNCRSFF